MNRSVKRSGLAVLLVLGILLRTPVGIMAATKPISSVSIRVDSKIEPGGGLPDIGTEGGIAPDGGIAVSGSGSKYTITSAQWVDKSSNKVKAADEPRMKVTLSPVKVSDDYFLASYKASNVRISGGSFVSASRDGDSLNVVLRINPVKGDYDPPSDAFWNEKNLGEARWVKPDNTSGYYELQLRRGTKTVHKVAKTSAVSYNFYPYMTEEGKYTFQVRTIAGTDVQSKSGKKSGWIESGELQITDRYVSDGKGQQKKDGTVVRGTKETVGWSNENKVWYYRYPDGNLCRSKWENIEGHWYYFNAEGIMLTGWQNINEGDYYLHSNGQMAVGWTKADGKWYYFRTEGEYGHPGGTMVKAGWRIIGPYYYYFNDDGSLFTGWLLKDHKWYYLNTVDNSLLGAMFTGWIKRDDKTYFADSNGEMVTDWCQIDGNWYYFYPGSGEMARNTDINGFHLDQDGVWR